MNGSVPAISVLDTWDEYDMFDKYDMFFLILSRGL